MATPRIDIDLLKIAHNAIKLKDLYASKDIEIIGVTKAVGGNPVIAGVLVKCGINILADSGLKNIKRMYNAGVKAQFLLLRSPFLSQIKTLIKYVDISLNSELSIIREISKFALKENKKHKIILMIELGDLREGIMPEDIERTVKQILKMKGVELAGIGTNLACLGGISPDDQNMNLLSTIAERIEEKFKLTLKYISGGNSANYDWFLSTKNVGRINNLRIGESIFLGCETLERKKIPDLFYDAFTLVTEVIESKIKPSVPRGIIRQDAFGNIPIFRDQRKLRRTILGIGEQDVSAKDLRSVNNNYNIIGSSSDHTIINTKKKILKVGDTAIFKLNYGALLSLMISPYISKNLIHFMNTQEFCEMVENNSVWHKEQFPKKLMRENNSPLVSLKDSGFNLIFEPSIKKDYKYLVRQEIVEKIGRISEILNKDNKVLIIRSAWRSN